MGSSIIRIRALVDRALAISTICCLDTGRSPTTWWGSMSIFSSSSTRLASCSIFRLDSTIPRRSSRPRNMFSATDRCRHMFSSWWMMATPISWACLGVRSPYCWPKISMVPASRVYTPLRIFISVDFPAPFSPRRASTSPERSSSWTLSSALTPGKDLQMPFMETIVSFMLFTRPPIHHIAETCFSTLYIFGNLYKSGHSFDLGGVFYGLFHKNSLGCSLALHVIDKFHILFPGFSYHIHCL